MSRLVPLAFVPLLGLAGCLTLGADRESLPLVNSAPNLSIPKPERQVSSSPAMKASSERVVQVGHRLILANPQIGLRPLFITVGVPEPEVFHKGSSLGGCQVVVSEGIVRGCPSDGELASVLALELGKIVAEREALAGPSGRQGNDRPMDDAIGPDSGGAFGSSDGTHMMEMARYEQRRRDRAAKAGPPEPNNLARSYLTKAGYEPTSLERVRPLLRQAEDHCKIEKSIGLTVLPPPPPAAPPAPSAAAPAVPAPAAQPTR